MWYCPITFSVREWCERVVCTSHPKAGVIFPLNMVWTVETTCHTIFDVMLALFFFLGGGRGEGDDSILLCVGIYKFYHSTYCTGTEHNVYSLCMNCILRTCIQGNSKAATSLRLPSTSYLLCI